MPVATDALEADTRGDGPFADIDLVIDVEGIGLGTAGTVLVDMPVGGRGQDRHVVDQGLAAGGLVHAFFQIAIADADFLGGRAQVEDVGRSWLDTKGVVAARVGAEGLEVAGGDIAAPETVGVVGQHFDLGLVIHLPLVLEGDVLAPAGEVVVVTHRLIRVGLVLLLGQATRHVRIGIVIMQVEGEVVLVGRRPMGLEQDIVDVVAVVAFAITLALHAGVQQRRAKTVVRGAAEESRVEVLDAAVARGFQGAADLTGEFLRNGPGHEVDHAADVLRSITHGTGTAYHVDAVQVTDRHRGHRQLWLAIRGECRRHAIDQHGGTGRKTRRQAAHADVEGNIAAAGAVVFLHLYARHGAQGVLHVHRALLDHGLAADHGPRPRVVLHNGLVGIAEPVAHHLDVQRCQLQRAGRGRGASAQGHRAVLEVIVQAAAAQQHVQGFFRRQVAVDRRCLLAGHQLRAEKHLQGGLLSQLTQGRCQGLGLDMEGRISLSRLAQGSNGTDRQGQGKRLGAGQCVADRLVKRVGCVIHV